MYSSIARLTGPPKGRRAGILLDLGLTTALAALVLVLQVKSSPRFVEMAPDSGLFAYTGWRILDGDLLYRDVFDTKPPGVFYLNAAALWIGGETVWPIWGLSAIWVTVTGVGLFFVLKSVSGRVTALAATSLFLVVLHQSAIYQGGNSTELFALLPQILILGGTIWYSRRGQRSALFLIGFSTGLAFLFKPTYIALGVASLGLILGWVLWQRRWREVAVVLIWYVAGFLLPLVIVAGYWFVRGGLPELIDALFVYGSAYVRGGLSAGSLYVTFRKLTESAPIANLTMLTAAGMFLIAWELIRLRQEKRAPDQSAKEIAGDYSFVNDPTKLVFFVAFLAIPLEWALVALSGQNFGHYFITPLPAMSTMAAFALHRALSPGWRETDESPWRFAFGSLAIALLMVAVVLGAVRGLPSQYQWNSLLTQPYGGEARTFPLVGFVVEHTSQGDTMLVWANYPSVNFQAKRLAPSRYLFPTQIFLNDGRAAARLDEILGAIERHPPVLVAEELESEIGIPTLFSSEGGGCRDCSNNDSLQAWKRLREYIRMHYGDAENVGNWTVYRRLDVPAAD